MRIKHNIMAMSAYRNYTNNVSAMKKNLEKLSSGYKINRAGDDAAGLAISEKMRAQITGLETAQKNAKDGISLVQTAEGALTEVHDMLNRMVELASMSANGTYDNTTDRAQLQKEMDQLRSEINRIADSSNFNGIKLLNGEMSTDATAISGDSRIIDSVYVPTDGTLVENTGLKTFLDGGADRDAVNTVFKTDFSGLKADFGTASGTKEVWTQTVDLGDLTKWAANDTITIGGDTITLVANTATPADATEMKLQDLTADKVAELIEGKFNDASYNIATSVNGNKVTVTYTSKTPGAVGSADYDGAPAADPTAVTVAATVADNTAGQDLVAAAQTTAGADPTITADFTLNGKKITGITLAKDDEAADIAQKVLNKLANVAPGGADATEATIAIKDAKGNDANYKVELDGTSLKFTLTDDPTADNINGNFDWDIVATSGAVNGNHTAGTTPVTNGQVAQVSTKANTVFRIDASDIKDGTKITIDGKTAVLKVGAKSEVKTAGANQVLVDLSDMEEGSIDLDKAIGAIAKAMGNTDNFIIGANNQGNDDVLRGITVSKKDDSTKEYKTKADLAGVFNMVKPAGKGLTLQIGDTADSFNQLKVSIGDMHTNSMGIAGISIADQDSAAAAVDAIKAAINKVSDVRGTLGATQNRLDHTINNLSVMTENIQDAESTIRDVDVAEEMMAYTKNNILIQSAQAMLAQANQVPQGVLQLLQ